MDIMETDSVETENVAQVPEIRVQGPEVEPKPSCSSEVAEAGTDSKERKSSSSSTVVSGNDENMTLRQRIHENVQAYINGEEIGYITTNPVFQELELKMKETLRRNYVQKKLAAEEIRQTTKANLLGISSRILNIKLCDLLRDADNPDTMEELFDKMDKEEIWKRQAELEESALARAEAALFGEEVHDTDEDEDEWETDDDEEGAEVDSQSNLGAEDGSTLQSDPELFKSEDEDESQNSDCTGSPDLFSTPRDTRGPEPQIRKVGGSKEFRNMITPLVGLRFPTSQESSHVTSPVLAPPVFQFQGLPVLNKEPRTLKPGEIIFSASGSPIVPSTSGGAMTGFYAQKTPTTSVKRPVRLVVDNPDGRSIQVELGYHGRPSNAEEGQIFRQFVTDVRGFITTRSTMKQKKLMTARVPNSASRRKPAWKL